MFRVRNLTRGGLAAAALVAGCGVAPAPAPQPAPDVVNYLAYDDRLASAGAVTVPGLERLRADGLEQVVYIGYFTDDVALPGEDRVVDSLGMNFVQVPVAGGAPSFEDFELFAAVMRQSAGRRTLVHCSSNRRAASMTMLYRVLYEAVPLAKAKADLNRVWTPNATWTEFILGVLESHGVDPDCAGCDWTPAPPEG